MQQKRISPLCQKVDFFLKKKDSTRAFITEFSSGYMETLKFDNHL